MEKTKLLDLLDAEIKATTNHFALNSLYNLRRSVLAATVDNTGETWSLTPYVTVSVVDNNRNSGPRDVHKQNVDEFFYTTSCMAAIRELEQATQPTCVLLDPTGKLNTQQSVQKLRDFEGAI